VTEWGTAVEWPQPPAPTVGWGDQVAWPEPPDPDVGWVGSQAHIMPTGGLMLTALTPTVRVGIRVRVPGGPPLEDGFPYEFPFVFPEASASVHMALSAGTPRVLGMPVLVPVDTTAALSVEALEPAVTVGYRLAVPRAEMELSAEDPTIPGVGVRIVAPTAGLPQGFPYVFPFELAGRRTELMALPPVSVVTGGRGQVAEAAGVALTALPPVVRSGVVRQPPTAELELSAPAPDAGVSYRLSPPTPAMHLDMDAPDLESGVRVTVPRAEMTLTALLPTAGIRVSIILRPPAAGTIAGGFPYEFPFELADPADVPATLRAYPPVVSTGATLRPPTAAASLTAPPPVVVAGGRAKPPVAAASFAASTPAMVRVGMVAKPPMAMLTLAGQAPTRVRMSPMLVTVTNNGRTRVPRGYRYISRILLGGGAGGANGSLFGTGNGGRPGTYEDGVWDRWALPEIGSVNVSIGGGGSGDGNAGGTTQIWGDAYDEVTYSGQTATAAGGSGTQSPRDAKGPGNRTAQGISAVGGTGNGSEPGSGGRGGASGFSGTGGSPGAKGRVWLRFTT